MACTCSEEENPHSTPWTSLMNASATEIVPSAGRIYGYTETDGPFDAAVAIAGILGDQQAALFGQACFKPGTGIRMSKIKKSPLFQKIISFPS